MAACRSGRCAPSRDGSTPPLSPTARCSGASCSPRRPSRTPPTVPAIDPDALTTRIGRIVERGAAAAGIVSRIFRGDSLERWALATSVDGGAHPVHLKRLGQHKSFGVLGSMSSMTTSSTIICSARLPEVPVRAGRDRVRSCVVRFRGDICRLKSHTVRVLGITSRDMT